MTSKDFMIWLQGFLDGNDDLTVEGVQFLKNKIKEVQDTVEITPVPYQYTDYKYLNPCPMGGQHEYPDIWHGILPPPCRKCGYAEPQVVFTYSDSVGPMCEVDPSRPCAVNSCCKNEPFFQFMVDKYIQPYIPQGMSYIEFEVPVDSVVSRVCNSEGGIDTMSIKVPVVDNPGYIDYQPPYFSMNWEFPVSDNAWNCCGDGRCLIGVPLPSIEPKNSWGIEVKTPEQSRLEAMLDVNDNKCCGLDENCLYQPLVVKVEEDLWEEDGQKYIEFEVELNDEDRNLLHTDKKYARFKAPIKPVPECLKHLGTGEYMFDFKSGEGYETYKELLERKIREASEHKCIKIMP
jgi:hypothetical protein